MSLLQDINAIHLIEQQDGSTPQEFRNALSTHMNCMRTLLNDFLKEFESIMEPRARLSLLASVTNTSKRLRYCFDPAPRFARLNDAFSRHVHAVQILAAALSR